MVKQCSHWSALPVRVCFLSNLDGAGTLEEA
jgi:hypothetical protein